MTLRVGTSGWEYDSWRGRFYPAELAKRAWLEYYAERFEVVEVNNTFYRLPAADVFTGWAQRTPSDFTVVAKMSRYLTHVRRLRDPEEPVATFFEHAEPLHAKLGAVLLQLPPNLGCHVERLDATLRAVGHRTRVAVEFRHRSWFNNEVRAILERHGAALCVADRRSKLQGPAWRTADFGYVRLHEGSAQPRPRYGDGALRGWLRRISDTWKASDDVFVFFNNDGGAAAIANATRLGQLAGQAGMACSRVPERVRTT